MRPLRCSPDLQTEAATGNHTSEGSPNDNGRHKVAETEAMGQERSGGDEVVAGMRAQLHC